MFEDDAHPLAERLRSAGVAVSSLAVGAPQDGGRYAVVVDPSSPVVLEMARAGAGVTAGPATPPDSLTAAFGAPIVRAASAALSDLAVIMARLRSPEGCPWDREQSHASLQRHLVEETYEVIDAIERGAVTAELEEELGDVLLQVVFHAQMASDDGRFDLTGVARAIVAKLVNRHPHVFGDISVADAGEVVRNWESIKAHEKMREGPFEDIPVALPALLEAAKTQKRAANLGFSPEHREAADRAREALGGGGEEALGEALFWVVAAARAAGLDPEGALRKATARFRRSFA